MPTLPSAALFALLCLPGLLLRADDPRTALVVPGADTRDTYASLHGIKVAQTFSRGKGVRVGILDHSFGRARHPALYAGGRNFVPGKEAFLETREWHGYWMSQVLREIAPEAEIYALNCIDFRSPEATAAAMAGAIDWAIEQKIQILSYSSETFKGQARQQLYAALERAHRAGIATTFLHCDEPGNILPQGLESSSGDGREADVNVLQYCYAVTLIDEYRKWEAGKETWWNPPYLSWSATAPVTAGVVALMKSLRPDLDPETCRRILRETAYPLTFEGAKAPRALDAAAALRRLSGLGAPQAVPRPAQPQKP